MPPPVPATRPRRSEGRVRAGRDPKDASVRACTGAVFGVMLQVSLDWANDPDMDLATAVDEALQCLEGLRP